VVGTLAALAVALTFHASSQPLPAPLRVELVGRSWHAECPVGLSDLRLLTVTHWGFDGRRHRGQLVVNTAAAAPLSGVFRRLYQLRFPIRDMRLQAAYGPGQAGADTSSAFECRFAVPSPCPGASGTGHWSQHAYGLAIDLNPRENPYTGCGRTRDRASVPYLDRSRVRRGMVTASVVQAFSSIGWGWGGSWAGTDKDYMHFSSSGH
jgi:D-alanyl-D-alanine carboxypeptidase